MRTLKHLASTEINAMTAGLINVFSLTKYKHSPLSASYCLKNPPARGLTVGGSHLSTIDTSGGPVLSPQDRETVVLEEVVVEGVAAV